MGLQPLHNRLLSTVESRAGYNVDVPDHLTNMGAIQGRRVEVLNLRQTIRDEYCLVEALVVCDSHNTMKYKCLPDI
jgi:hypothetical protein